MSAELESILNQIREVQRDCYFIVKFLEKEDPQSRDAVEARETLCRLRDTLENLLHEKDAPRV